MAIWPPFDLRSEAGSPHPDPVKDPGFTWTPGGPKEDPHEVFDRIDWVLRAGPGHTVASRVVGEHDVSPYPTDHDAYVVYACTHSEIEGRLTIGDWPLPPGRYVVRLLPDDGLRSVAEPTPFTVAG